MSKADDIFWREFGIILALLVLFGIAMFFLARGIAGAALMEQLSSESEVAKRTAPVASVRVGDPTQTVATAPPPAPTAPETPPTAGGGEAVYNSGCAACHATGAANAPKLDDQAAWEPRLALGSDALVSSVVNGKGAMPPKGGMATLTEDEIRAAVEYMVAAVGGTAAGAGQQVAAAAGQMAEQVTEAASAAASAVESAASQAAEQASQMVEKAADAVSAAAEQATAAAPAAGGAAAGKPGSEVYNMGCVACHATGAANAPKLSDKAAWETRMANGLAAMVQSAVKGKGAMPPKGGLMTLTDADVENAVRYMLEQAGLPAGG